MTIDQRAGSQELTALAGLTFDWTRALDDVWTDQRYHVDGLHAVTAALIGSGIRAVTADGARPLGIVIQGQRGVGKTHLLGWTREQVQRQGGFFFLVGDLFTKAFWEQVLGSMVEQLLPLPDGSRNQLATLLTRLADQVGLDGSFRAQVTGEVPPTPEGVKVFIAALRRTAPSLGLICQDTARALVLLASPLQEDQDVGYYYLTGNEVDLQDRRHWRINSTRKIPRLLVNEVSQLLALAGPIVLAIDQVDALIDELVGRSAADAAEARPLADVATGLMALRDVAHRTLTIVSCLPESWEYIRKYGVDTVTDRFREARQLRNIPSADVGRLMIEKRFAVDFGRAGFEPPYPTWPILPAAFDDASKYTARALLKRIEAHVARCLQEQAIAELDHLDDVPAGPQPAIAGEPAESPGLAALDRLFARLTEQATVGAALEPETEDAAMPPLLAAGLEAWARELGGADDQAFVQEPLPGKNPRLHACLRMLLDTRTERQRRWAFRAIASNSPRAVQTRLRKAIEGAGLAAGGVGDAGRRLFVLRSPGWPTGPVTEKAAAEFTAKGGMLLPVSEADLKTFAALGELLAGHHPELNAWLLARRPAHGTELLGRALADAAVDPRLDPTPATPSPATPPPATPSPATPTTATPAESRVEPEPQPSRKKTPTPAPAPRPRPAIRIGLPAADAGRGTQPETTIDLAALRRHLAIFAGSGSGKTVLLRRVIEECALQGVSSIVLDPNNDLARLGDAWPDQPAPWLDGDAGRAADYLAGTDVVLWTPRRESGRPLTFQPLPDFGAVLDDVDEFNAAVDAAVEALAPRVGVHRASTRAAQEKAVLTEAMRWFGRGAGHDLGVFIDLLSALPEHVTEIAKGPLLAAELADRMRAVRATDPLFGGAGEPADPGMLLTPPPGKRARISVISSVGMSSLEQWQGFVNQLQMALFSWVKRNPAEDRPLGGLLVMDEAQDLVPSVGTTACSESTRRLASQARKYGLGLLFATQSPKSLHNSIPGNATTQLFGLLSSPVQIGAARELAWAKGGSLPDIGRLSSGQFYLATEGSAFRQIRTPMCLSYHPSTPLTEEEVLSRAAR
jgi:Helicase HerA, central domain